MPRRVQKSATPLTDKQQELARKESELRGKMEQLQQMIADAPRVAEEKTKRERENLHVRANERGNRLDATISIPDKRYGNAGLDRRHRPLRQEQREGRLLFLVLVIALAAAVMWLMTHLHF